MYRRLSNRKKWRDARAKAAEGFAAEAVAKPLAHPGSRHR